MQQLVWVPQKGTRVNGTPAMVGHQLGQEIVTFPRSKPGPGYQVPLNDFAMDALNKLLDRSAGRKKEGPVIRKPSGS